MKQPTQLNTMGRPTKEYKCVCGYDVMVDDPKTSNKTQKLNTHKKYCAMMVEKPNIEVVECIYDVVEKADPMEFARRMTIDHFEKVMYSPDTALTFIIPRLLLGNADLPHTQVFKLNADYEVIIGDEPLNSTRLLKIIGQHAKTLCDALGDKLNASLEYAWNEHLRVIDKNIECVKPSLFWPGQRHMIVYDDIRVERMKDEMMTELRSILLEKEHAGHFMTTLEIMDYEFGSK